MIREHLDMSVRKTLARLLASDGSVIGEGRAYVHLRLPDSEPQAAQGTLSLDWWDADQSAEDAQLELVDGLVLKLDLDSDKISACINGRVLRYRTRWPGDPLTRQ
jgi:hypothetical protein